jgi:iron complex outermembrane receptor protein
MKRFPVPSLALAFALLPGVFALAPAALGQTAAAAANDQAVVLPSFDVTGTAADPYRPVNSQSVIRVAGSIMDSPFSVNVMSHELIEDLGANSVFDVSKYFAGVSPGRGTGSGGIQDRQDFRGFENLSKSVDNFSSFLLPTGSGYQATFDPAFIERVELVMGPNSVLSPTGSPGGSSNVISKSPQFKQAGEVDLTLGNYNAQKFVFDSTGPIGPGDHWAYRVIGTAEDTQTYEPGRLEQYNASAQFEYAFSPTAKVVFKYFGEQWGLYGPIANTNDNGEMVYTPDTVGGAMLSNTPQPGFRYDGPNGGASWGDRIDHVNIFEVTANAALGTHVNMRLGAQILYDRVGQQLAFPKNTPGETYNAATGQSTGVTYASSATGVFNPTNVPEVAQISRSQNREIQLQNDYVGNFDQSWVSIEPVVGWSTQSGRTSNNYTITDSNTADVPPVNLYANGGAYTGGVPAFQNFTGFSANTPEVANLFQAYGLARFGFFQNRLYLMGGASRIWATVNDYSFKGITFPSGEQVGASPGSANYLTDATFANTGSTLAPTQSRTHDTYLAGVLVKVLPNVSLYGSLSTNAGITANNPLWQSGKQYEFGVKSEFFNQRLQITADHFQIAQANVSTPNPLFNTGQSPTAFLLSDQTSHGFEFNVVGGITPDLSVIASLTDMKLRDPLGRRIRNVPDQVSNLLLNYHFRTGPVQGLSVFGGVNHMGSVAGETVSGITSLGVPEQPGFYLKPWTVVNVGSGYTLGRYRFNLNLDNALNSHFWWQPASRISVSPYPGATVRFTTEVHF